ncbi:hypothetical protein HYQ46_003981 [Verticillium longisporum]|nr:hypothetical protein HYQ44_018032 [Verticillium longisporum]KAG7152887.1 hypothetical protein HYQ46_003981 [Verticillium longisporum]
MSSIIQPRRRMSLVGKSIHQALRIQESTLASKLLSSLLWAAEQTEPDRDLELRDVYMPHSRADGDVTIPSLYMTSTYQATRKKGRLPLVIVMKVTLLGGRDWRNLGVPSQNALLAFLV